MSEPTLQQQLGECAGAASAGWAQLIRALNWTEINQHDDLRRLLVWAVAWASEVGMKGTRIDVRTAQRLIADIEQLGWPDQALPMRQLIRRCAELALSLAPLQAPPTIDEFDLHGISDAARILLTVRAAERACLLLPARAVSAAQRATLRAAIDWARGIGEGRLKLEAGAEGPHMQAISAQTWPGSSVHVAHSVISCLHTAGNPWIWEMSQARFQHLVASVDLQHAVRAGVNPADIGRDYLELQHLDAKLLE